MRAGEQRSTETLTMGVGGEGADPFCHFVDGKALWAVYLKSRLSFIIHCNK